MQAAAVGQEYERAGLIKRQIAFAEKWRKHWSRFVRRDHELVDLLAIPVTRRRAHKLFLSRRGYLTDGPVILDRKLGTEGPTWVVGALAREPEVLDATVRMEQTWLVAHFMHHKEAETAIRVPLPGGDLPVALDEMLRAKLSERTARDEGG
jgi:hypothetical protein